MNDRDDRRQQIGQANHQRPTKFKLTPEQARRALEIADDDSDDADEREDAIREEIALLQRKLMAAGASRDDIEEATEHLAHTDLESERDILRRAWNYVEKVRKLGETSESTKTPKARQNVSTARTEPPTGYIPPVRRRRRS